MDVALGFTYIVIVCLWLIVLVMIIRSYRENIPIFGGLTLLFAVIAFDAATNVIENTYFLTYFLSKFGYIPNTIFERLGHSGIILVPKLINILSALLVIAVLFRRWLPIARQERHQADDRIRQTADALAQAREARRLLSEQHDHLLNFDRMTGLPNRNRLQQDLSDLQAEPHALVVLEIDGFNEIGQTLSRPASEALLRGIFDRISSLLKENDRCYRLGESEFALMLLSATSEEVINTIRTLQKRLEELFEGENYRFFFSTSAGVAFNSSEAVEDHDLLSHASLALRDAKAAGGRAFRVYTTTLRAEDSHASNSKPTCGRHSTNGNLSCSSNRRFDCAMALSLVRKPCCAGVIRNTAPCRQRCS